MKTKTISAIKTYQVQQFVYDKIGLEDTFALDIPDIDCIKQLHERIDAMAREVYPWYFESEKPFVSSLALKEQVTIANNSPNPDWGNDYKFSDGVPPEPKTTKEKILQQIQECTDRTVLETFRLLIKNDATLSAAYDNQMSKIKKISKEKTTA